MASSVYDIIDSLNIGRDWKLTFKKIHITYYRNYANGIAMYPIFWTPTREIANLSFLNAMKMNTWFNPLGLVFGPLYYLLKGLYVKGIILLIIFLLLLYINSVTQVMSLLVLLYCAVFINMDCFEKMILKHPEVVSNPIIIGDDYDQGILVELLSERTSPVPYIILLVAIMAPFIIESAKVKNDSESLKYLISEPEAVCKAKEECLGIVREHVQKINKLSQPTEVANQYYEIARTYYSINDTINAVRALDTSISFDHNNANAFILRAKAYTKMNNNFQSLLDYKEALKINPQATFLNYYIGFNYYALGKYESALEYFEKATRAYDEPSYFEAQAYARYMLKDKQGTIRDIKKAIALYNKAGNTEKVKKLGEYLKNISK